MTTIKSPLLDQAIGPIVHNIVVLASFAFTDADGIPLELSQREVDQRLVRIAYQVGGAFNASKWPSLVFKFGEDDEGNGPCTVSMFSASRAVSLKGRIDYSTLKSVFVRIRSHFAAHGEYVYFFNVSVKNILSTVHLARRIDMESLCMDDVLIPNYDPSLIGQATFRPPGGGPTVLVWRSGVLVIMGTTCKTMEAICDFVDQTIPMLEAHASQEASACAYAPAPAAARLAGEEFEWDRARRD